MTWQADIPGGPRPRGRKSQIKRLRSTRVYIETMRSWRARFPICQRCNQRASTQTHHIVPVHEAPELLLAWHNLMAVCDTCHEAIHTPPQQAGKHGAAEDHDGAAQKCKQNQRRPRANPWTLSKSFANTSPR